MKKLDLSKMIGILANVGVIAGIVFLGIELQQNNELLETEARFEQAGRGIEAYTLLVTAPGLANAVAKLRTGDELDVTEQVQLQAYAWRVFRNFQWQYDEMRRGTLDESLVPIMRAVIENEGGIVRPAIGTERGIEAEIPYREYWEAYKRRAPPDFVEWFEENVVNAR